MHPPVRSHLIVAACLVAMLLASTLAAPPRAAADPLPWRDKGAPFGMVTAVVVQ